MDDITLSKGVFLLVVNLNGVKDEQIYVCLIVWSVSVPALSYIIFPQGCKVLVALSKMLKGNICQYDFKDSIRHLEVVTHAEC